MKRLALTIAAILICGILAKAQNFQIYSFGESELASFNPAAIMNDGTTIFFRGNYEWYNTDQYAEKPYNFQVGGDYVGKWGGVYFQKYYDEYSYFTRHGIQANYAYQWHVQGKTKMHHFSIGGGLSLAYDSIDMGYLKYDTGQLNGWSPDMNIGFEYANDNIRTGIGGVNLFCNAVTVNGAKVTRNPRVLLTYFMYRFDIKDVVGITPMVYVGYCEKTLVEVSLRTDYKKIVFLSYGFRAMDLRHIVVLNVNIPKTPVSLDISYTGAQFYYAQTLSGGIRVRL